MPRDHLAPWKDLTIVVDDNQHGERSNSLRPLLAPLVRGNRGRLAALALTTSVGGLAEAAVLVIVARVAFALGAGDSGVEVDIGPLGPVDLSIGTLLLITAGVAFFRLGTQVANAWQVAAITTRTLADLRKTTVRLFLEASWGLQSREREGQLQELSTTYISQVSSAILQLVRATVSGLSLLVLLGSALAVNFVATLAVIAAVVTLALVLRPIRSAIRTRSRDTAQATLVYATAIAETATTAREVKIFNVHNQVRRRIDGYIDSHVKSFFRTRFLSQLIPGLYQASALLFVVVALTIFYLAGLSRLASLGAVILIMLRSFGYGQALQASYHALHESAPYLERVRAEQRRYREAAVTRTGSPIGHIDEIAFDRVWFEYEPNRPVLKDVSFRVHRGEVIGIVGPSGSGKSTLVQLILQLREPTAGSVLADGRDVRRLSLDEWYERVSFVPQDARLISGTVADNIRFFRDGIDDAAIERAARLAHLHEDVASWPLGYQTAVGERGDQLSGGQRQRLCIARSLADEPDVLVLDEPTSALDARSEAMVRDTLTTLAPRTTILIIAHRLSTLDTCERLMIVQAGELLAFDAPEQLRTTSPLYRETLRLAGLR